MQLVLAETGIVAMGLVVLGWVAFGAAFIGIGLLLQNCLGVGTAGGNGGGGGFGGMVGRQDGVGGGLTTDYVMRSFWIGLSGTIFVVSVLHIWWPMGKGTGGLVLGVGAAGLLLHGMELVRIIGGVIRSRLGVLIVMTLMGVWLANRSIGPTTNIDSAGYHLAALKWVVEEPLIPGLANVCARLGLNYSTFLYYGMIEGLFGHSWNIGPSLLIVAVMARAIVGGARVLRGATLTAEDIVPMAVMVPLSGAAISSNISSPSTDVPAMCLTFAGIGASAAAMILVQRRFQEARTQGKQVGGWGDGDGLLCAALAMLSVVATFKLTHLVLSALVCGMLVIWRAWVGRFDIVRSGRFLILGLLIPAAVMGVWLYRGVVLSGYPLFPSRVLGVDVAWRVPTGIADVITAWAKWDAYAGSEIGATIEIPKLLKAWARWQFTSIHFGMTVLPAILMMCAWTWVVWMRIRKSIASLPACALLMIPLGLSLVAWLLNGPMPRYGSALFWSGAGVSLVVMLPAFLSAGGGKAWRKYLMITGLAGLAILPIVAWAAYVTIGKGETGLRGGKNIFLMSPGPDEGFYALPEPELDAFYTGEGLEMRVPSKDGNVWFAAQNPPATSVPSFDVVMREQGNRRAGFMRRTNTRTLNTSSLELANSYLAANAAEGDRVYVTEESRSEVLDKLPAAANLERMDLGPFRNAAEMVREFSLSQRPMAGIRRDPKLQGQPPSRTWFIFADGATREGWDEMPMAIELLDWRSKKLDQQHFPGVSVYLYQY